MNRAFNNIVVVLLSIFLVINVLALSGCASANNSGGSTAQVATEDSSDSFNLSSLEEMLHAASDNALTEAYSKWYYEELLAGKTVDERTDELLAQLDEFGYALGDSLMSRMWGSSDIGEAAGNAFMLDMLSGSDEVGFAFAFAALSSIFG